MSATNGFDPVGARAARGSKVDARVGRDRIEEVMTPEGDALYRDICSILEKHAPSRVELTPATDLSEDLNIDSVAAMDLIMEIEDKFGIDIPMNLVSDLRNLQDLVDVVRQQIEGR
jgi:acyl carrier protein